MAFLARLFARSRTSLVVLLALSVTLRGFQLNGQDGAPLVGFDELYVDFSPFGSLLHRAWSFSGIRLQSPVVHAEIRADRTLNLMQLVLPPAPGKPPPSGGTTAEKPRPPVWVGQLALLDGRVQFRDLSHGPAIETAMLPVRLVLTRFSTKREANNAYTFAAVSQAGERSAGRGISTCCPSVPRGAFRSATCSSPPSTTTCVTSCPFRPCAAASISRPAIVSTPAPSP